MSTEYQPFLGVGITYESLQGVHDLLDCYGMIQRISISNDFIEDIEDKCDVEVCYLGMYDTWFIGYKILQKDSVVDMLVNTQAALSKWEAKFKNHIPDFVSLVDSY